MTVIQLRASGQLKPETPRCEAERQNRYANDRRVGALPACKLASSFVIDGKHYCKKHAGDVALRKLMDPVKDLPSVIELQCDHFATGTQMREFLRYDDGDEPYLRMMLRLNLEQFVKRLYRLI